MQIIIEIPDYNLNEVQNGSIACSQILKAVKNGKPYEERPTGHWIVTKHRFFEEWDSKCSCCNEEVGIETDFCPNCGADMRKETADMRKETEE